MTTRAKRSPRPTVISEVLAPADALSRHDGWTAERQVRFLQVLSASHNVSAAARSVGMSRQSAYKLRARLRDQPFDYAWDAAFQSAFDALAEAAMERALSGVEVPHYHKGELVGTSRRYDERLTIALLSMRGSFVRPPAAFTRREACGYEPEDFRALLKRVADGPETWEGEEDDDVEGWDGVSDRGDADGAA